MPTKYQMLASRLRDELLRNSGRPGWKLPTEQELSQQHQVSRQTVRHTLRLLEEERLIQRRQGSGSYATGQFPVFREAYKSSVKQESAQKVRFIPQFLTVV